MIFIFSISFSEIFMKNVQLLNSFSKLWFFIFIQINAYCHTLQSSFKAQSKTQKHVSVEQFSPGLCWCKVPIFCCFLKIFQGNKDYHQDVRNNFLPPIIARFIRVNPTQWQQKIAMKMELLGCQFIPKGNSTICLRHLVFTALIKNDFAVLWETNNNVLIL